jgi:hypothetical protein
MRSRQIPGPGREDGEEHSSSPSSFSGKEKSKPEQPTRPSPPQLAAGFAEGGAADVLVPGAELAGLVSTVTGPGGTGLAGLADREVLGVLGAGHKLAAWAAWVELVTLAEFTRRRPALATGVSGARAAAEEAAWVSAESWSRMLDQAVLAQTAVTRLPQTLAAMSAGTVSGYKLSIIAAQTTELSAEDAAKADVMLAAAAMVRNPAALRDFARRQVTRLDPQAQVRRKEKALRKASVRVWQEDSGNMALSAREMPNGDGQIAWQNIERRALDLHAAGMPGTTGQLQVQAMLDYLLGHATPSPQDGARQNTHKEEDRSARQNAHDDDGNDECARQDAHASARTAGRGGGRGGWAVNPVLTVPWDPARGRPSGPAELPGYGLLDPDDTIDLLDAAGQHPASRWCFTRPGQTGPPPPTPACPDRAPWTPSPRPARPPAAPGPLRTWPPPSAPPWNPSPRVRATTRTPNPATGPPANSVTS